MKQRLGVDGMLVMGLFRLGATCAHLPRPLSTVLLVPYRIINLVFARMLLGAVFPPEARIGHELRLPHGVNGIVIHQSVTIGDGVMRFHQVTLGQRDLRGGPTIGDGVLLGVGAKVLGPITVGDRARIGAGSVVLTDVPPFSTVAGVPARVVRQRQRPEGWTPGSDFPQDSS